MSANNDTFLGIRDLDAAEDEDEVTKALYEPWEVIAARVLFALLVSVSLVLNLLLLIAVIRRSRRKRSNNNNNNNLLTSRSTSLSSSSSGGGVHVIYWLACAFLIPDLVFYAKLALEMSNWGQEDPVWASDSASCAAWQFATHWCPIAYAVLLLAIVHHAFITLFLDYTGSYEKSCRKFLPVILLFLLVPTFFIVSPSAIYSRVASSDVTTTIAATGRSHFRQYCELEVPPLLGKTAEDEAAAALMAAESAAAYRLCYEVVLPFLAPLCFLMFPYICLLLGLMRGAAAAAHADLRTKMSVVVTLWFVTTYLALHVASLLRSVLGVLAVWARLVAMFDAYDDERVPKFQTYIHVVSYALTCLWAIIRASLCFKYNAKLRKALGS